jgi:hypothetical protein
LDKLDVYQKAYSRAPKSTPAVLGLQISDISSIGTAPTAANEPAILRAARELLIAYGVAEKQDIKINELIKERAQTPDLIGAVAHVMETKGHGNTAALIGPEVKNTALDSIMSACTDLSFKCQTAQK